MRVRSCLLAVVLLVVCGIASTAAPQGKKVNPPRAAAGPKHPNPNRPPPQNPAKELERFQKMSPADREKELAKLPPQRRQQLEQRLERFEKLSPEQRQKLLQRLQTLHDLPPERANALRQELQKLNSLPPADRKGRLNSDSEKFSPEELKLLREWSGQPEML
jgi:hypothetical protein